MARPAIYPADDILDVAAALVRERGPAGLRMAVVAARLGAPSGSIYHRFRSRDVLAASLWLRTIERFQDGWMVATEGEEAEEAVRRAARYVVEWCRTNPTDAQLLMLHRSRDLLTGDWPEELRERNQRQLARVDDAIGVLARRLGIRSQADRRRLRFALLDIPYGAVRPPLSQGRAPEPELDQLVDDAVLGVLAPIQTRRKAHASHRS